jgi:phosphatidylinositol-3-phosphatase
MTASRREDGEMMGCSCAPREFRVSNLAAILLLLVLGLHSGLAFGQSIPRPDHVVIVIEENHSYGEVIGNVQAPYINSLAQQGALFTRSFGVTHPSEPNYLALFSGSTQGVTDDGCSYTFGTPNLGRLLYDSAYTFGGYSEDLPATGSTVCNYLKYFRKHNPWVNWQQDISPSINSLSTSVNMPFSSFPSNYALLPTVSFVVPNQDNDMHDGTIQQADSWLQAHLDGYIQWAQSNNSLLIVTWDEDDSSMSNQIPTIFVGPMVQRGQYAETINHYNVLRTIEDMFGLSYAGQSSTANPITDCWTTSVPVPAAPGNLSATAVSASQINLTWTDNSANETGFHIYRSTNGTTFVLVGAVGSGTTSFANTGLQRNTKYYYRVRAFNASGESADSNTASTRTRAK